MKTIKQIADELGVSKQRVYRYVKKNCINEAYRDAGVMYYDDAVEMQIKQAFNQNEAHQRSTSRSASRSTSNDTVDTLVEMLQKELEVKNQQIEKLTQSLQFEQGKNKELQDKVFLLENKTVEEPSSDPEQPTEEKKSFWKRFFS